MPHTLTSPPRLGGEDKGGGKIPFPLVFHYFAKGCLAHSKAEASIPFLEERFAWANKTEMDA